jgi:hypothetical protein
LVSGPAFATDATAVAIAVARRAELTMVFADMQSLQKVCGYAVIRHVWSYVVGATDVTGRLSLAEPVICLAADGGIERFDGPASL